MMRNQTFNPNLNLNTLVLEREGAWGEGFAGYLTAGAGTGFEVYLGELGAKGRAFWRRYARGNGYRLVEATGFTREVFDRELQFVEF